MGMDISDKILIDLRNIDIEENKKIIRKIKFMDDNSDFSKISLKTIEVHEILTKVKEKKKKGE